MNILEIAQEAADICAVARPKDLFNSNAQNDQLFASVVKSTLSSLMRHAEWQALTRSGVLYTVDGVRDYLIDNIAPDFQSFLGGTFYIKDDMRNVVGSISPQRWAKEKQYHCPEIDVIFKIENNMIRFLKNPGVLEIRFNYKSNAVCIDARTQEPKPQITANTDIPIFDAYVVKLGIIWRWNKRSGLDYAEEYEEYRRELDKSYAEHKAQGEINLAYNYGSIFDEPNGGAIVNGYTTNKPCGEI